MAVRKKRGTSSGKRKNDSLAYEIWGLLLVIFGVLVCVGLLGYDGGIAGDLMRQIFHFIFGIGAVVPAILAVCAGVRYVYLAKPLPVTRSGSLVVLLYFLLLSLFHQFYVPAGKEMLPDQVMEFGGAVGGLIVMILRTVMGEIGTSILLVGLILIDVMVLTHWSLSGNLQVIGNQTKKGLDKAQEHLKERIEERNARIAEEASAKDAAEDVSFFDARKSAGVSAGKEERDPRPEEKDTLQDTGSVPKAAEPVTEPPAASFPDDLSVEPDNRAAGSMADSSAYRKPPLSLLKSGSKKSDSLEAEVNENAQILENTLKSFGVSVKILNVSIGPSVTRYELEPAPGVKVSRIVALTNDIALQMAATDIRMEAPIPGKSAIGIEVPNKSVREVCLRDVLESNEFRHTKSRIAVALGKDITGKSVVTDLTRMPHLLIAGATGSGKSVCINGIIASILFRSSPEDVKLVLIDPKVVELSVYNGIPHLMTPVVTAPKKAAGVLHWAVKEMEARYQLFAGAKVRDIGRYNEMNPDKKMPFIVIIIDEMADLMMAAPDAVEDAICRLAQMARAAGIHLVLATQRPSVDVITGIIKANIPSRISFAVSSQVDSRTILDMAGAEKLIGKGDMLFYPIGASKPQRMQGAFISDTEVEKVTQFLKTRQKPQYEEIVIPAEEEPAKNKLDEEKDELLEDAVELVMDTQKASVSMLQRRFRIGYTRAGRLMDTMESMGIVSPADGMKPREILMTKDQVQERYFGEKDMQ